MFPSASTSTRRAGACWAHAAPRSSRPALQLGPLHTVPATAAKPQRPRPDPDPPPEHPRHPHCARQPHERPDPPAEPPGSPASPPTWPATAPRYRRTASRRRQRCRYRTGDRRMPHAKPTRRATARSPHATARSPPAAPRPAVEPRSTPPPTERYGQHHHPRPHRAHRTTCLHSYRQNYKQPPTDHRQASDHTNDIHNPKRSHLDNDPRNRRGRPSAARPTLALLLTEKVLGA